MGSGDSGVRGDDNDCYEGTEYIASFPASAVYVTAVGGVEGGDLDSAASSIAIYALARSSEHPSDFASNVKWVQMEPTHSGHVPASWKEREECGSEEAFTLTLALKQ